MTTLSVSRWNFYDLTFGESGSILTLCITGLYAKTITAGQMALSIDLCRAEIIDPRIRFNRHISFWNIEELALILDAGHQALEPFKDEFMMVYRQKYTALPPD